MHELHNRSTEKFLVEVSQVYFMLYQSFIITYLTIKTMIVSFTTEKLVFVVTVRCPHVRVYSCVKPRFAYKMMKNRFASDRLVLYTCEIANWLS